MGNLALTLQQIQNEVVFLTKESQPTNPIFATIGNVTTYANEAQTKIARRTRNRIKSNFPYWSGMSWFQNQYQKISFGKVPTSGTITFTFNGQTTSSLSAPITASALQTALQALTSIGANNLSVYGNQADGFTVIFLGPFIGQTTIPLMTDTPTSFNDVLGNTVVVTITGVTAGNQDAPIYTIPGQRLYDLPADFMQMIGLNVNNIPLRPARHGDFDRNIMWQRLPGFPLEYYFERDSFSNQYKLGLFLTPTTNYPIGWIYIPEPTAMISTTDLPDIEDFLHPAIVHYVCKRIMEGRREYQKAEYWRTQYESDLQDYESSGQDTDEAIPFLMGPRPTD